MYHMRGRIQFLQLASTCTSNVVLDIWFYVFYKNILELITFSKKLNGELDFSSGCGKSQEKPANL